MAGMAALKKILGGANTKLDDLLMKSSMMRKKAPGMSVQDGVVSGGQAGLVPNEIDPRKKAALLGALGLGAAGTAAGAGEMMEDEDELEKLKSLLGL